MEDHTEAPADSWMGWSNGHWEGETLVVDTTGFNDLSWFDRAGNFHSDALHVVERITARSAETPALRSDDRGSRKSSRGPGRSACRSTAHVEKNAQMLEFKCVEFVEDLIYGHLRKQSQQVNRRLQMKHRCLVASASWRSRSRSRRWRRAGRGPGAPTGSQAAAGQGCTAKPAAARRTRAANAGRPAGPPGLLDEHHLHAAGAAQGRRPRSSTRRTKLAKSRSSRPPTAKSEQTEPGTIADVHYDFTQFGLDRSQATLAHEPAHVADHEPARTAGFRR